MGCCSSTQPKYEQSSPNQPDYYHESEENQNFYQNSNLNDKELKANQEFNEEEEEVEYLQEHNQQQQEKEHELPEEQLQESIISRNEDTSQSNVDGGVELNKSQIIIPAHRFKKQLQTLQISLQHASNLQRISEKGQKISRAITELGFVNQVLGQTSHPTQSIRKFKTDLIDLYGNLHLFRSFHLRYVLDEQYFVGLPSITELNQIVKESYIENTSGGITNYEQLYDALESGNTSIPLENLSGRLNRLQNQYDQVVGQNFSRLPNYLYVSFCYHRGFSLWTELFPNDFEISNQHFSEYYSEYCGIAKQDILSIIQIVDNANDKRIDIYQWIEFVQDYEQYLDSQDKILPSSLSYFESEIQNYIQAMRIPPKKLQNGSYQLPSGMIYQGQLDSNNRKQGKGTLRDEEYSFEGTFHNDFIEGQGIEMRKNIIYEGEFKNGLYHGYGKLAFPNGRSYVGNFENHQLNGEGELTGDDGIKYQGIWKYGVLDYGKIIYHDGSFYHGQLGMNFFKHGKGQYFTLKPSFSQRSSEQDQTIPYIEGIWEKDTPQKGKVYSFFNSEIYDGSLNDWTITGKGLRQYQDGTYQGKYDGVCELIKDKKNNIGQIFYQNGDQFDGVWKQDQQVRGLYQYGDDKNHTYEGEFKKGKMAGKGKYTYPSGATYEGEVQDGQREGKGTYIFKTGNVYDGYWSHNKEEGEGQFLYIGDQGKECDIYSGQFKQNKFNGFGHYYYRKTGKHYVGNCNSLKNFLYLQIGSVVGYWKEDKWNGEGKFYNPKGNVKKAGIWEDDILVEEKDEDAIVFPSTVQHLILQNFPEYFQHDSMVKQQTHQ